MTLLTFSKRERCIFIIALVIITLVFLYNFMIEPFFEKWGRLNAEITLRKIRLTQAIRLLKNKNVIIHEYNDHRMPFKNLSGLIGYIEKHLHSLGIKTANLKPRPVHKKDLYGEYIIELQIEGKQDAINRFVSKIIRSPIYINVKKFDLRGSAEDPSYLKGTLILSKITI